MAFCNNCNGYVVGKGICPKCRIPVADWNDKEKSLFSFLGAALVIVLLLAGVVDWLADAGDKKTESDQQKNSIGSFVDSTTSGEVSSPEQRMTQASPPTSAFNSATDAGYVRSSNDPQSDLGVSKEMRSSSDKQVQSGLEDAAGSTEGKFIHAATLVDSRGIVTIQSGPGIAYRNIEKLPAGTTVYAADLSGKWVEIRLDDGRVGFVRRKQLSVQ